MNDEQLEPITPRDIGFLGLEATKRGQFLLGAAFCFLAGALADGHDELEYLVHLMDRNVKEKRERMAAKN